MQGGLSSICATCTNYWQARERGVPGDGCLAKADCAGPAAGGDFPEYRGPITDFSRWCFVCGEDADFGVRAEGRIRTVGVCEKHVRLLADVCPDRGTLDPKTLIRGGNGTFTAQQLIGPEKKSLMRAIGEVEAYYASKRGY